MYSESMRDFGDACACAAAMEKCEGRLLSLDRDLSKVPDIQRTEEPSGG